MDLCPFCEPDPGLVIFSDGRSFGSLLADPRTAAGHAIVVPMQHAAAITELSQLELSVLMVEAQRLGGIILSAGIAPGFQILLDYLPWQRPRQQTGHLQLTVLPRRHDDSLSTLEPNQCSRLPREELISMLAAYQTGQQLRPITS